MFGVKDMDSNIRKDNEEIDLIEVFSVLWKDKLWIVISMLICSIIGVSYAFMAKEQYTSKAEILKPSIIELEDYYGIQEEYANLAGLDKQSGDYFEKIAGFTFQKFLDNLYSKSLRLDFFKDSSYYLSLVKENALSELQQKKLLDSLSSEQLKVIKPDIKKDFTPAELTISFNAETAEQAQDTLVSFVNYTNSVSGQILREILIANIKQKIEFLNSRAELIKQNKKNQTIIQLANLERALLIAKTAGIEEYSREIALSNNQLGVVLSDTKVPLSDSKLSDGSYLFMLGSKYLQAQIDVIKENKEIYSPEYYLLLDKVSGLEKLLDKANTLSIQSYHYLSSPDYPTTRDKPKRLLILLVSVFLGLVLGIILILLKNISNRLGQ